jgi:hypothetical protein
VLELGVARKEVPGLDLANGGSRVEEWGSGIEDWRRGEGASPAAVMELQGRRGLALPPGEPERRVRGRRRPAAQGERRGIGEGREGEERRKREKG